MTTPTETPLTSALFASLPAYTQETLKFMPLCEQLENKLADTTAQLEESRRDKERLEHLFAEAWLPSSSEPTVPKPNELVLLIGSRVPLDHDGYRATIDAAMQQKEGK